MGNSCHETEGSGNGKGGEDQGGRRDGKRERERNAGTLTGTRDESIRKKRGQVRFSLSLSLSSHKLLCVLHVQITTAPPPSSFLCSSR